MDLTKLLKQCPEGTKLYSIVYGVVTLVGVEDNRIIVKTPGKDGYNVTFNGEGKLTPGGECLIFPAVDCRDWEKFTPPPRELPQGTPVLFAEDNTLDWRFGYYRANRVVSKHSSDVTDPGRVGRWIVEFTKFNPYDNESNRKNSI